MLEQDQGTLSLEEMYAQKIKKIDEGSIVRGEVVGITNREVLIDVGYKSEGIIPRDEFEDESLPQVGDEIEVLAEKEDEDGMLLFSRKKVEKLQGWERILSQYNEGDLIDGKIIRRVKGGFIVNVLGLDSFMPASLTGIKSGIEQAMNKNMKFQIVKINKARRNVVVSHKHAKEQARQEVADKLWTELKVGEIRKGKVKNLTDFGAFIDLGGVDGLLHITDMSWSRISHPSEMLALGDEVEVMILSFDRDEGKVSLGLKQKSADPWSEVEDKYPIGSRIKGKVVNILPYGAFVELEKGVEGLVHISELSWTKKINDPSDVLAIGDVIEAVVLSIDVPQRKISLGIKQTEADPWSEAENRYPVNSRVKVKVRGFSPEGAFVLFEDGLEGFIPIDDISWTRKPSHPQELLKKGRLVEAIVLSFDMDNRRILLGVKQLFPDPWPKISQKYQVGQEIEGKVIKVADFGLFVELEEGLEGLVYASEIDFQPPQKLEEMHKVGDKIMVTVIKVDVDERKIGLSMKEDGQEQSS